MARLATFVHVHKDGASHAFGPDDEVPEWAAALITNPAAWEGGEVPTSASRPTEPAPPVKRATSRKKVTSSDDAVHSG